MRLALHQHTDDSVVPLSSGSPESTSLNTGTLYYETGWKSAKPVRKHWQLVRGCSCLNLSGDVESDPEADAAFSQFNDCCEFLHGSCRTAGAQVPLADESGHSHSLDVRISGLCDLRHDVAFIRIPGCEAGFVLTRLLAVIPLFAQPICKCGLILGRGASFLYKIGKRAVRRR